MLAASKRAVRLFVASGTTGSFAFGGGLEDERHPLRGETVERLAALIGEGAGGFWLQKGGEGHPGAVAHAQAGKLPFGKALGQRDGLSNQKKAGVAERQLAKEWK